LQRASAAAEAQHVRRQPSSAISKAYTQKAVK